MFISQEGIICCWSSYS